jgi:site-specific DNA recombinase
MSPSHTRRRGRIYRYYVAREAIADGYDNCAVTSVPAAEVEGAVLDNIQKVLGAPELVARTGAAAKRRSTRSLSAKLFPPEQARITHLLVERVDVQEEAIEVRIRADGLASFLEELRQGERKAA